MDNKTIYGIFVTGCLTTLQIVAWALNKDGVIFATTSGIIGLIAGALIGFKVGVDKAKIDTIEGNDTS